MPQAVRRTRDAAQSFLAYFIGAGTIKGDLYDVAATALFDYDYGNGFFE